MSKKGGYVIIDLKDTPITVGTPVTVDGIYEKLERAPKKTVLLSGLTIGDEEKRDVFIDVQKDEDDYVGTFGNKKINISEDGITVTESATGGKLYCHKLSTNLTGNIYYVCNNPNKFENFDELHTYYLANRDKAFIIPTYSSVVGSTAAYIDTHNASSSPTKSINVYDMCGAASKSITSLTSDTVTAIN